MSKRCNLLAYSANYRPLVVPEVITWSGNGSGISFLLQNHPRSIPDWRKILPLSCFDGVQSTEANSAGYHSTNYRLPIQTSYTNYRPQGKLPSHATMEITRKNFTHLMQYTGALASQRHTVTVVIHCINSRECTNKVDEHIL